MTTGPNGSTDALSALGQDIGAVLHEELQRIREDLWSAAGEARLGAALLGGAAVVGALAAGTSAAATVRLLERALPRPAAASVAAALFATGAGPLARRGVNELRRAAGSVTTAR